MKFQFYTLVMGLEHYTRDHLSKYFQTQRLTLLVMFDLQHATSGPTPSEHVIL